MNEVYGYKAHAHFMRSFKCMQFDAVWGGRHEISP